MKNAKLNKIVRITTITLSIMLSLLCFGFSLYYLITKNDPNNRLVATAGVGVVFLIPYVAELIMRKKLSNFVLVFFMLYATCAGLIGSAFTVYKLNNWYDKVIHSLFGYVGCIIGLFAVCKMSDIKSLKPAFVVFVCFSVSLMIGALWEICEFCSDQFLGQTAQGFPVETITGEMVTTIKDTMLDIICNFGGAVVFCIHYVISKATKKNLLIESMTNDFSRKLELLFTKKAKNAKTAISEKVNDDKVKEEIAEEKVKEEEIEV